jgi:hypothetical protein
MCHRFLTSASVPTIMIAVALLAPLPVAGQQAAPQAQSKAWTAPRTADGKPDLQGVWDYRTITPLERPVALGTKAFFTDEEAAKFEQQENSRQNRDTIDPKVGGLNYPAGGVVPYNEFWYDRGNKVVGTKRTSLIVDPPNGRIPPLAPEAQKLAAADRDFRLALLQSTDTCKSGAPACAGGKYDPTPSPRRAERPPRYNTARINRNDGPEDMALGERCLTGGLPEFGTAFGGSFRRIVQTPGGISIFYDVGQGQGWQRTIVMDGRPHLPNSIRQWYGDSRGRWDGNTLVIDVTNFSPKTDFQGSRENLHLTERWTRLGPNTLEYVVTIDDPTVWTRPWTVKQEFSRQNEADNRIYYEPRCIEGNYGLPGILHGRRAEERAFAEGRGPDPATRDNMTAGSTLDDDPLR